MSRVKSFDGVFEMPVPGRSVKPRKEGITMIIDKGLGLNATQDLLDSAGDVIDFIKLTFGTSAFLDLDYLGGKSGDGQGLRHLDLPRRDLPGGLRLAGNVSKVPQAVQRAGVQRH